MSKIINVDFADRVQRRFPVAPVGTPYQPARHHNVRDMKRRAQQAHRNMADAFRGGFGHRDWPDGAA